MSIPSSASGCFQQPALEDGEIGQEPYHIHPELYATSTYCCVAVHRETLRAVGMCRTAEPALSSIVYDHRVHGLHPGRGQPGVGPCGDPEGRETTVPRAAFQRGLAAQLRGGDAVPVPAVVEEMTVAPGGVEACLSLTRALGPRDAARDTATSTPDPAATRGD